MKIWAALIWWATHYEILNYYLSHVDLSLVLPLHHPGMTRPHSEHPALMHPFSFIRTALAVPTINNYRFKISCVDSNTLGTWWHSSSSENISREAQNRSDGAADLNLLGLLPCRMREYLTLLLRKRIIFRE